VLAAADCYMPEAVSVSAGLRCGQVPKTEEERGQPPTGGRHASRLVSERETGLDPATLCCLESKGSSGISRPPN